MGHNNPSADQQLVEYAVDRVLDETNTRHLNGVHPVFGKVTKGLDIVEKIQKDDVMNSVRVA